MALLAIAGILGAASALAGTGYALSGAGQPTQPNLSASSAAMSNLQARMLPYLRALQAAAEEGGTALRFGYKKTTATDQMRNKLQNQLTQAQNELAAAQAAAKNAGTSTATGKTGNAATIAAGQVATLQQKVTNLQGQLGAIPAGKGGTVYLNNKGQIVPASQALADFSGYSQADIQGTIEKEMAQAQLELSQKYDPQFIASALEQEKLADPQSFEGRQKLYDLMQEQMKNPPTSPVADEMQKQVSERVAAGSGLTADEESMLNEAVQQGGSDRGNGGTPQGVVPDWAADLTTGFQGEQRAMSNAGAGTSWLASGETPEDILYRSEQQNLSNLGNFIRGQTPQAQFRELSGAQQGPTPVTTGGTPGLPTLNPSAGAMGANAAVSNYQLQIQQALNQPNPWMSGLSGLLGVAGTAGAAGYKPFASSP